MIQRQFFIALILLCSTVFSAQAQQKSYIQMLDEPNEWVDSVFHKMNKRHKIAQMFFVRALSNAGKAYEDSIGKVIRRERIGGLVFFQGGPGKQTILTNKYQSMARTPLLIASDGEWGLGMRLDSTVSYPYQMALGAVQNTDLIYQMGLQVAKDYKRIGMQMNFGPVADVNNNAKNPVINYRSFGEDKYNVARKASAYVKGMQDGGLLVSIKHFPGHGDTDVDSHVDLPQLNFSRERLDSLELYPFKEMIKAGASGVMVAHMNIPSLDTTAKLPSTLSKPIVTGLLKEQLGFKGLVVSDAMEMKGVVKHFPDGEADVMGVIAGNDILELPENSRRAVRLVRKAVREHRVSMEQIDQSVKKILMAKYWSGLNQRDSLNEHNVLAEVNRPESQKLVQQLADASMTLLKEPGAIKSLSPDRRTVIISLGTLTTSVFQQEMRSFYKNAVLLNLDNNSGADAVKKAMAAISASDQVIVSIVDSRKRPGNGMPMSSDIRSFISNLAGKNALFVLFANPYNLASMSGIEKSKTVLVAYQKEDFMQKAAASVFKNQLLPTGKLPVTVNSFFKFGDGLNNLAVSNF